MRDAQSEVGSTASSYTIIAKLATGGMADIFLARTETGAGVERYVVLKRVLRHRATDVKFVNMFLDEARLASQLQHPNIAQVFDTGKLGDSYFFTMEYVHGETVRELLHRAYAIGQKIPLAAALTIVAGAAAGLQHAHERVGVDGRPLQIVHRDVSPSNLMISFEGNVKVVDFGVAKASVQSTETQEGTVKGKIGYMAPEQCRGGHVDQRCDLFSLGIVMWELLVGQRLFKRNTEFETMEAIVGEEVAPPSSKRPEIPASIDAIVLRLLAKRPADRYQSADELHEAIENAAVGVGIALSVPALKRYIREIFGQRPEPWVEMRLRDSLPEIVTVTGHLLKEADIAERQLERVLDLSSVTISSVDSSAPRLAPAHAEGSEPRPNPRRTSPPFPAPGSSLVHRPPTAPTASAASLPLVPSEPNPLPSSDKIAITRTVTPSASSLNASPSATPDGQSGKSAVSSPRLPARDSQPHRVAVPTPSGSFAPPASPSTTIPVDDATAPSTAAHGSWSETSELGTSRPRVRPLAIAIGVIAGVIAVIVVVVISSSKPSRNEAVANEEPAGSAATETPAPRPEEPAGKPDATTDPKPTQSQAAVKTGPAAKPAAPDVEETFQERKFADVVSRCATSGEVLASHVPTCVLAACRIHDGDHARRWAAKVKPAERDALVSACASAGTALAKVEKTPARPAWKPTTPPSPPPPSTSTKPKDPKPNCDPSDPMSCRR